MITHSEALVELGLNHETSAISASAYTAAQMLLLDTLGCALAGHAQPGLTEVVAQMREWGGKPEAAIMITGERVPAPHAAFANSAMIHALDYDDVHVPGVLHLTSVVVPAVLASAQMVHATGKDALAAIIMGIEVAGRLGIVERSRRRGLGFLPSSTVGGFGAVIAAARLLGLSPQQAVNAMGINYAQASGTRQALLDMSLTKRLQPAFAVRSALWAVGLAGRGVTGPQRAFEGKAGYYTTYLNGEVPAIEELTAEHGAMQIERVSIKRFPSCGACHNVQIAAERLVAEESLAVADIARVEIFGCGPGGLVGGPFQPGEHPQVDAQFNAAWGVAHTLLRGPATLDDYTDAKVRQDHEVAALANRIRHIAVPEDLPPVGPPPPGFPQGTTRWQGVVVHTHDGRRLMRVQSPAQTRDPTQITRQSVVAKFRQCAAFSGLLDAAGTDRIIQALEALPTATNCDDLMHLMIIATSPQQGEHP